ncbi:MAG: hypothetical protein KC729_21915, partial [Candidatus Eisenbacteria bacterium]|nr:hypothetical protein [Candidatus Eisenbacteria bacterium]
AIDYFVTSNYIATPTENYYLPDTTGGFFFEFEILPSWRLDAGHLKFPCLLYVDTNSGAEPYVESALGALGLDHDRFDYNDATSSWKVPMNRGSSPSNNGVSLPQLAAYRTILVNTGGQADAMWREDDNLFREWLTNIINPCRRALIMNGDNLASTLADRSATFLNQYLGATLVADAYHDGAGGDDQNYCVRLEAPVSGGESYGTVNSHEPGGYQYDAWGNWCPQQFRFDVLGTIQDGVGNRAYLSLDGPETEYAQVTREDIDRLSILDGTSWHHLSERDPADECAPDS